MKTDERHAIVLVSEPGNAGVKTHVINLLRNIDVSRFRVTYYYSMHRADAIYGDELAALRARGIECIELEMDDSLRVGANAGPLRRLIRELRAKKPAVLHLHSSKAGGLGRLASMFVYPRPAVLYTPNAMACYRSSVYTWLERGLGLLTGRLVAASPSERDDFVRWRIPGARRAAVITLGVAPNAASEAAFHSPKLVNACWTVGACGRISYQKNPVLFFETALEAVRRDPRFRFKWIGSWGDDDESKRARALLERAGNPPEIRVTGWITDPGREIASLDAFCMLSRYESFGYVTAEAMQLGVPVVATPTTGTVDLVEHEVTGLLTEADVSSTLAALCRLREDPALATRLARTAKDRVASEHSVARMISMIEDLYVREGTR